MPTSASPQIRTLRAAAITMATSDAIRLRRSVLTAVDYFITAQRRQSAVDTRCFGSKSQDAQRPVIPSAYSRSFSEVFRPGTCGHSRRTFTWKERDEEGRRTGQRWTRGRVFQLDIDVQSSASDTAQDIVLVGFFHPPHGRGSLSGMSQTLLALASTAGRPSGW